MPAVKRIAEVDKLPLALPPVVAFVAVTVISEFIELIANMELNEFPKKYLAKSPVSVMFNVPEIFIPVEDDSDISPSVVNVLLP